MIYADKKKNKGKKVCRNEKKVVTLQPEIIIHTNSKTKK